MKNSSFYIIFTSLDKLLENDQTHEIQPGTWIQEINNINETIIPLQTNCTKKDRSSCIKNKQGYYRSATLALP